MPMAPLLTLRANNGSTFAQITKPVEKQFGVHLSCGRGAACQGRDGLASGLYAPARGFHCLDERVSLTRSRSYNELTGLRRVTSDLAVAERYVLIPARAAQKMLTRL